MITILLFKDLPNEQSLEAPFEIVVQDLIEAVTVLLQIEKKEINYYWDRIIIKKGE